MELINSSYLFVQMCIASDDVIKKEETRREFRKIEQEALLDENDINTENVNDEAKNDLSIKCEGNFTLVLK